MCSSSKTPKQKQQQQKNDIMRDILAFGRFGQNSKNLILKNVSRKGLIGGVTFGQENEWKENTKIDRESFEK